VGKGPSTFRQRDLTRALRAAAAAGVEIARFEISREGVISLIPGTNRKAEPDQDPECNEWDNNV
jgi:hypothetical protein